MMKYGSEGLCPHCEHCESCPHNTKDTGASIQVCTGGFIAMSPSASFEVFTIKVKGFKPRSDSEKIEPIEAPCQGCIALRKFVYDPISKKPVCSVCGWSWIMT